ncbi:hypothetical protein MMC06_003487 [Schaereria dolodes]|nr:hypothetical protein [Schaereria dolodes]
MRIRGEDANGPNGSSYRQLEKARNKVFSKELVLLAGLRQHLAFTSWEPAFGGRFPKKQYEAIVGGVQRILDYMALIAYASNEFSITEHSSQEEKKWMKNFSAILSSVDVTSQEITSTLSLMSGITQFIWDLQYQR